MADAAPGIRVVKDGVLPDNAIAAALVDGVAPGRLKEFANLKLIMSLSAGVEKLLGDPYLPAIPVVRLVTEDMAALMREYVVYHVLRLHRGFHQMEELQSEQRWEWMPASRPARLARISILGLGKLGLASAEALRDLGFQVAGWSRTPKVLVGIQSFSGSSGLHELLSRTEILVCLLPFTTATSHLLAEPLFERLPAGASIINASRGACQDEEDLLRALDSGRLSHATLDVFATEPLPKGHRLWSHPRVTVTPHAAAYPLPESFIPLIATCLARIAAGQPLDNRVDLINGY
jgi:glyoxylate/hydroxypyruvate reductase A